MNGEYIKKLSLDELYEKALPFIQRLPGYHVTMLPGEEKGMEKDPNSKFQILNSNFWKRVLTVEKDRLERLDQVGEGNPFFFEEPKYDKELLRWKDMTDEEIQTNLRRAEEVLTAIPEEAWTRDHLGTLLLDTAGDKRGEFLWPLRVALSGTKQSPPPQDIAWVIGKEETFRRMKNSIAFLISN